MLLKLPGGVNILNLTAPSLRTYKVNDENGAQQIDVQFTQEMEGQFRIELSYEKITSEKQSKLSVPTLTVEGTEVEHGKIAVEALSAVEVQAAEVQQLSTVDPSELPKQLILKTTNPILLAYKYVQADPPFSLALKVTRHREIDIESAAIDRAHYASLYTRDGIAVTAARYTVRNSRKQFLRVRLPADSELWAVTVNGKSEKPALAEQKEGESAGREVLIKIINSTTGFPVELVYLSLIHI